MKPADRPAWYPAPTPCSCVGTGLISRHVRCVHSTVDFYIKVQCKSRTVHLRTVLNEMALVEANVAEVVIRWNSVSLSEQLLCLGQHVLDVAEPELV